MSQTHRSTSDPVISPFIGPDWERRIVVVIVTAFLLLTVAFSLGPISESPDEFAHYTFIRYLIRNHNLPDPVIRPFIQAHQAPLYYALGVPFLLVLDNDSVVVPPKNPWGGYKLDAVGNDNKNVRLHSVSETFPYTESPVARAIHLTRILSILMGLGNVIACYFIFRLLWPSSPALRLAALGFVAFWPQFLWLSSVLNNDNLLNLMSTLTLLVLLVYQRRGWTLGAAIVLGVTFGLALIAKASAVFLAMPIGVALLLDLKRWRYGALALAIAAVLGAWWYVRNLLTIHTLSGWPAGPQYGGLRPGQSLLAVAWERLPFVYQGFWARFGQVDIPVSPAFYTFFNILLVVSLLGTLGWLVRAGQSFDRARWNTPSTRAFAIMTSFALCWLLGVAYSAGVVSQGNQGRYLLPGIAAWAAVLAIGVMTWIPDRLRLRGALTSGSMMACVAMLCLFGYFLPAYRPLDLPAIIEKPLDLRFGDSARLIGIAPSDPHGRPGDTITISLYWQAIAPSSSNLAVYLHSVDSNVVKRDSFPATGNLRSSDWQPGQTWEERYVITLPKRAEPQMSYALVAGLYNVNSGQPITPTDALGNEIKPSVGRIAINGPIQPFDPDYRFGDSIGLATPTVTQDGDQIQTCLRWVSLAPAPLDYQMFIHVISTDGTIITQDDFQPKNGQYPTGAWSPGEVIEMCVPLDAQGLASQNWRVSVGLYDLATGARPPVVDRAGVSLPDNMVVVNP